MTVRELITKVGFDVDDKGLDDVGSKLDAIKHRLDLIAGIEVLKGIFELTEKFSKFAQELSVAAQSAGVTVEAFQKLSFAAAKSTVSQEQLGTSMARLSRHLYDARNGGAEAQKVFARAGFSAEQVQGFKNGQDVLLALADRFKGIQDPIKKQAIAMELLGRGSVNMVAFLSKGSGAIHAQGEEAKRLGAVLTGPQINALVKVEHAFMDLWAVIKGISGTIAATFAPEISYIIGELLKFWEANQKVIMVNVVKWIKDFSYGLGFIFGLLEGVTQQVIKFAESHKSLMRFLEALGLIVGALIGIDLVMGKVVSGGLGLMSVFGKFKDLILKPFNLWLIAIALMVIAVHDLWNAVHGKPTWVGAFIEWLGIGQEVQAVFFSIFEIIQDIMNLDFKKALGDLIGDVKGVRDYIGKTFHIGALTNAAANLNSAPALGGGSPAISPSLGATKQNYSINAPVNINVPAGADPTMVGKKVKEGIKEHLDRVYRETNRSLQPAQAY